MHVYVDKMFIFFQYWGINYINPVTVTFHMRHQSEHCHWWNTSARIPNGHFYYTRLHNTSLATDLVQFTIDKGSLTFDMTVMQLHLPWDRRFSKCPVCCFAGGPGDGLGRLCRCVHLLYSSSARSDAGVPRSGARSALRCCTRGLPGECSALITSRACQGEQRSTARRPTLPNNRFADNVQGVHD